MEKQNNKLGELQIYDIEKEDEKLIISQYNRFRDWTIAFFLVMCAILACTLYVTNNKPFIVLVFLVFGIIIIQIKRQNVKGRM